MISPLEGAAVAQVRAKGEVPFLASGERKGFLGLEAAPQGIGEAPCGLPVCQLKPDSCGHYLPVPA
jgi:hypothetical protein